MFGIFVHYSTRPIYDVSMNLFCWPPSVDILNIVPGFLWQPLLRPPNLATFSKIYLGIYEVLKQRRADNRSVTHSNTYFLPQVLSGALREWFNRSKFRLWIRTGRLPVPEKFQGRLSHAKALFGPGKLFYVCLVCIPNQVFNISLKVRNVIEPKQD